MRPARPPPGRMAERPGAAVPASGTAVCPIRLKWRALDADSCGVRTRAWKAYLVFGALGGFGYYFVHPVAKSGPFFNFLGASSVAVILIGTRMHRPGRRLPWFLFAAGQSLFIMGDVITYNYQRFFHHEIRSEEHTSELQSRRDLVCRLLLEKKKTTASLILSTSTIELVIS